MRLREYGPLSKGICSANGAFHVLRTAVVEEPLLRFYVFMQLYMLHA